MNKVIESFKGFLKPKKLKYRKYQRMLFIDNKIVSLRVNDTESTKCNYKIVKYYPNTKKYFKMVESYKNVLLENRFKLAIQGIIALYPYKTVEPDIEVDNFTSFFNIPSLDNIKTLLFLISPSNNVKVVINTSNKALWFNMNIFIVSNDNIFRINIVLTKDKALLISVKKSYQYYEKGKMYANWVDYREHFFLYNVNVDSRISSKLLKTYKETFKNVLISDIKTKNKDIKLLAKFLSITTD